MNPVAAKGRRHNVYPPNMYCGLLEGSWSSNGVVADAGERVFVIFLSAPIFKAPPRTQFTANRVERYGVRIP